MSEYQYYEWQTIDRNLTSAERTAVSRLSSHIDVRSNHAIVTYNWSSFRHDPKAVLLKYFDAHFYTSSWGRRLMFRFPAGLLNEADLEPFLTDESISFKTVGEYAVLDLDLESDDGWDWAETEESLDDFIPLRADLIDGDNRLLYLAWLKAMTVYGYPDVDDLDPDAVREAFPPGPPIPPGLKRLSPALESFIQVFGVDPFLVKAAAEASPDRLTIVSGVDYAGLVRQLPRHECDEFLLRLAQGEPGVGLALRKRLERLVERTTPHPDAPRRSLLELYQRSEQLEREAEQHAAEAARRQFVNEMQALAPREEQTWQQVEDTLDNEPKTATVYEKATLLLVKLRQLAEYQGTVAEFNARMKRLQTKYITRHGLIRRWKETKLLGR